MIRRALLEGFAILSAMTVWLVIASQQPGPKHDPVSPDFHITSKER